MTNKSKVVAQNPLIMRCHRLMEAFAKSDDERDFYIDRYEGFLIYIDLDKSQEELDDMEKELLSNPDRYCHIPKLTFYEIKKVMEGFVNEKVYDIDTKEKLLDIIQSKEARENFLEFIYDHHSELEKWQQYYQERFRVRIIEWLRNNRFDFVFEEDLELTKAMVEKLKLNIFVPKVSKDILAARKILVAKAKTYYSNEALNPRPKRGRPPKQVAKVETEPQFSQDIYTTIAKAAKPFLFAPDYHSSSAIFTFSGKFASEADLLAHRRQQLQGGVPIDMQNLSKKLATLRSLSASWNTTEKERIIPSVTREKTDLGMSSFSGYEPSAVSDTALNGISKKSKAVSTYDEKPTSKRQAALREESSSIPQKGTKLKGITEKTDVSRKAVVQKDVLASKSSKSLKKVESTKSLAKEKQVSLKPNAKVRLRPLSKKQASTAGIKEKAPKKGKTSPLRMLRRAKKR